MANFNKVILIGNLTRDPECRTFANGGKVAKFGFAVNNRKKNSQTGQWEDEPMYIDCEAFNRGENGTLANIVEQYCRKGSQICIEGRLKLDQWDDKTTGAKRSKHMILVDTVQLLGAKPDGQSSGPRQQGSAPSNQMTRAASEPNESYDDQDQDQGKSGGEIPF
ncbi:MAG: single-stranded DNA-binding protein [Gemmataceae bacterium]|nr:single-stranded DNA-binding protein [Gemmataceae bacterium]